MDLLICTHVVNYYGSWHSASMLLFPRINLLSIPLYDGSVDPDSAFDPSRLCAVMGQRQESRTCNTSNRCYRHQPLPYLVILMELGNGNESNQYDNGSNIKYTASEPPLTVNLEILTMRGIQL